MRLAVILGCTAVAAAGCAHTVAGAPVWNAADAVSGLRPADADQVLLGPADVSAAVGVRLQVDADRALPIAGSSPAPACSALDSVGMTAFVGDSWTGFHVVLFTDGDRRGDVVAEAVAVYSDPETAASVFATAAGSARACDGQRAVGTGGDAAWGFTVGDLDADVVRWRKEQLGIPMTWVCHGEARLRSNAILQAMVCRGDDGGATVVTSLADRMSAHVWELSDR